MGFCGVQGFKTWGIVFRATKAWEEEILYWKSTILQARKDYSGDILAAYSNVCESVKSEI